MIRHNYGTADLAPIQSTKDLASALNKSADTVTYIQREGVKQRLDDEHYLQQYEDLDRLLIGDDR